MSKYKKGQKKEIVSSLVLCIITGVMRLDCRREPKWRWMRTGGVMNVVNENSVSEVDEGMLAHGQF